ncbi:hypothetical protein HYV79_01195 [Candidatus Woesearchaeota archaeon]|nr:hypothetical protein [Candidatus Woesearchaeota archaeon]
MKRITKNHSENWEVSIIELRENGSLKYKVTRHLPKFSVAETKMFNNKEKAKKQFEEWLQ